VAADTIARMKASALRFAKNSDARRVLGIRLEKMTKKHQKQHAKLQARA
jgi:hypothetical protein